MMLYPERRKFTASEQSGTMVAIYSTLQRGFVCRLCGSESRDGIAGDSRVSESAGEMDLVWRSDCGDRDVCGAAAESANRCWCFPRCGKVPASRYPARPSPSRCSPLQRCGKDMTKMRKHCSWTILCLALTLGMVAATLRAQQTDRAQAKSAANFSAVWAPRSAIANRF